MSAEHRGYKQFFFLADFKGKAFPLNRTKNFQSNFRIVVTSQNVSSLANTCNKNSAGRSCISLIRCVVPTGELSGPLKSID